MHMCVQAKAGGGAERFLQVLLLTFMNYIQQIGSPTSASPSMAPTFVGGGNRERNLVICTYNPRSTGKTQTGGNTKGSSQVSPKKKKKPNYKENI